MDRIKSFAPVADENIRLLILGSMPGPASLRAGEYYAFRGNRFWRIMGALCGFDPDIPYEERLARLLSAHVGLWDVISDCEREGALDSDIRDENCNPVLGLIAGNNIRAVAFNGRKSEETFRKRILGGKNSDVRYIDTGGRRAELISLPSTSPAYASLSFEQKLGIWRERIGPFIG